jgi:hypothetical protein
MPLDPNKVMGAVQKGLSIVCATCRHYWRAKDAGLDGCGKTCAGPISGDNFPLYDGELPDLLRFCFVCGRDSEHALQIGQKPKKVGVCAVHLNFLTELLPKDAAPQLGPVYASKGTEMLRVERIVRKPEKTLVGQMIEQEKAWQEEDRFNAEKLGIDPDTTVES